MFVEAERLLKRNAQPGDNALNLSTLMSSTKIQINSLLKWWDGYFRFRTYRHSSNLQKEFPVERQSRGLGHCSQRYILRERR